MHAMHMYIDAPMRHSLGRIKARRARPLTNTKAPENPSGYLPQPPQSRRQTILRIAPPKECRVGDSGCGVACFDL